MAQAPPRSPRRPAACGALAPAARRAIIKLASVPTGYDGPRRLLFLRVTQPRLLTALFVSFAVVRPTRCVTTPPAPVSTKVPRLRTVIDPVTVTVANHNLAKGFSHGLDSSGEAGPPGGRLTAIIAGEVASGMVRHPPRKPVSPSLWPGREKFYVAVAQRKFPCRVACA